MDPLNLEVFKALQSEKCGDEKIDDSILNTSRYIAGILKKHDLAIERIEKNKGQYTQEGMDIQKQKAARESLKELQEVQDRSSWKPDIAKVEKRFDDLEAESDIRVLIRESREREVRSQMREFEGDTLLFHAQYGPAIEAGDPVVCGAIVNSPMQLQVDPALLRTAGEKYRLAQNPMAADRLGTLTKAQTTHDDIFNFARGELGLNAQADNIDDLAAGKPLTAEMQEVKIE